MPTRLLNYALLIVNYALNMSAGYFGDLVKKECGLTPQQIINNRMVAMAKERLEKGQADISSVAYELGFQYPHLN